MRLITSEDLFAKFAEGKRVVFVGNAPSLKGEKLGPWIDSFDVVVRFNDCPTSGFEEDVGIRTDIIVLNPYSTSVKDIDLNPNGAAIIISPQTRRPMSEAVKSRLAQCDVLFTFTPDVLHLEKTGHKSGLTTGVYGIHLLSRVLSPGYVGITGFTMFLGDTSHHYWGSETPGGLRAHDVKSEAAIFVRLCNTMRCDLEITEEIAWVAREVQMKLQEDIAVRRLANSKWRIECRGDNSH